MDNKIVLVGKIEFEPEDKTKKHEEQSTWKKTALVLLDGDVTDYYSWFLNKRYNIKLNRPLRRSHVSFINDSIWDLQQNGKRSKNEVNYLWNKTKNKWNGVEIPIMLDLRPRTNDVHWWLNIPNEYRDRLHSIRAELGLGRPFFGLHMSIGHVNEKNIEHSKYIHSLIKSGLIN